MSVSQKIAIATSVLLAISELLPLLKKDLTEATSVLTLIFPSLRKIKHSIFSGKKHARRHK